MKAIEIAVLGILIFLAGSSGVTKIFLMAQDVEFFGKYGFSNFHLIVFGAAQVLGGIMMIFPKSRLIGAAIVAITFAVSAVLLITEGNVPFTIATLIALLFLGWVMGRSLAGRWKI